MTIAAIPLPPGQWQFCDQNGVPYAGGSVTHYYPGGTAPKDTYQDSAATILNDNPITLDSAGRATIFGIGEYRQILKDSLGNTIWDSDTVGFIAADVVSTALVYVLDGGGLALTTGVKGDLYIPFACTITACTLLADQSGSLVVDIWKDVYANYPPTIADTITGPSKPTLSSATHSQDNTLSGWTTAISAGDTLRYDIVSAATIQRCTVTLNVTKT
jgi:hypothetical protein